MNKIEQWFVSLSQLLVMAYYDELKINCMIDSNDGIMRHITQFTLYIILIDRELVIACDYFIIAFVIST